MVRASGSYPLGRRFESDLRYHFLTSFFLRMPNAAYRLEKVILGAEG